VSERDLDLEPLSPEVAALLDAERGSPGLSAVAERRLLARLEDSIARGVAPPALDDAAPVRRRWPVPLATFLLGLGLGGALCGLALRRPEPRIVPPLAESIAVSVPQPISVSVAVPAAVPRPARMPRPPEGDDRDRELAAERALLETARTAAQRGQGEATLEALAAHAKRFPSGRLAEERESLWVAALVEAGRTAEARQRAARFHARFPSSLLGAAVDAAVRSIPGPR
jgi:hypothetical protein